MIAAGKTTGPALLSEDWPFVDLILLQRRN
jgi:hypothetical protein